MNFTIIAGMSLALVSVILFIFNKKIETLKEENKSIRKSCLLLLDAADAMKDCIAKNEENHLILQQDFLTFMDAMESILVPQESDEDMIFDLLKKADVSKPN